MPPLFCSGRLGSQRPVASHDADHSGSAGVWLCPSRVCARPYSTDGNGIMSQEVDPVQQVRSTWLLLRQEPLGPPHKPYVQERMGSSLAYNGARCLAHSAVVSEEQLGSNPISIAPRRVQPCAYAHDHPYPSHVRRRKLCADSLKNHHWSYSPFLQSL